MKAGFVLVLPLWGFLGRVLGQTCTFTGQCKKLAQVNYRCGYFQICTHYYYILYSCEKTESCSNSFGLWSTCTASCGSGGTRQRTVTCTSSPSSGTCSSTATESCNIQPCPTNSFGPWSTCTASCAPGGIRQRSVTCTSSPSSGNCSSTATESCNTQSCPINGNWGQWNSWADSGTCSVTCCQGTRPQTRTRQCDNPPPSIGGATCPGDGSETRQLSCGSNRNDQCPLICGATDTTFADTCRRCVRRHYVCNTVGAAPVETFCATGEAWSQALMTCTTPEQCRAVEPPL